LNKMKSKALALVALLSANGDFAIASGAIRRSLSDQHDSAANDRPKYTLSKGIFSNTETIDFIDEIVPSEYDSAATNFEDEGENLEVVLTSEGDGMCRTTESKLLEHITETLTSTGYDNLDTDLKRIHYLNLRIKGFMKKIDDCNITDSSSLEALGNLVDFKDILEVEEGAEDCAARGEMKEVLTSHCEAMSSAKVQTSVSSVLSSNFYGGLETDRQKVCYIARATRRYERLIDHCNFVSEDMDNELDMLRDYNEVKADDEKMKISDCNSKCPKQPDGPAAPGTGNQTAAGTDNQTAYGTDSQTVPATDSQSPRPITTPGVPPYNGQAGFNDEELLVTKNAHDDDVSKIMDKLNDIYDEISDSMGMP